MRTKNVDGIEMSDELKKLYFNALNVPKDMAPWGGIMNGFRVRKRVMHLDAEALEYDLKLICDKACDPTDIGIIKELAQSWIDYDSNCPKICYDIVENYGTPRETFIYRVKQIIDREGIPRFAWYTDSCYLNLCYIKDRKLEQFGVWMWSDGGFNIMGNRLIKEEFEKALSEAGCPNVEVDDSDGFDYWREEWIESGEIEDVSHWA